jgi:large subunit ribosomal protein L4|uniref:ribosomal protein L4 n=1 Tax=Gonyostomum semen TaxID=375454 RepID=UPI0021155E06|nr:ribosomal protein L4 [Gonyostomum semen]UTE94358.1 ribosomal protein L4 [Gonyostomum semen]
MLTNQLLQFSVKNLSGQDDETTTTLNLKVQNEKSTYLIHRALVKQLIEHRQGNANTKTRSEVRGGGRKPWKQKGTGRARAGSKRSPLWKGGGVSFGPRTKKFQIKLNKKEWRLALQTLLFNKKESIIVIKDLCESFENIQKTQSFLDCLKKLSISNVTSKILIIVPNKSKGLIYSTQNIKNIDVILANSLNIKSLLDCNSILIATESLKIIEETYGK